VVFEGKPYQGGY